MSEGLKNHLPVIIATAVLGILLGGLLMSVVKDNASLFNASAFSMLLIAVPCVIMFVASFVIMLTAREIGSRLLIVVEGICLVLGLVSMVVASSWEGDATIAAAVLANSGDGATLTPVLHSPFGIVRNIMLYLLVPMVASIAGAWLGSRLHPVGVDKNNKPGKQAGKKKRVG